MAPPWLTRNLIVLTAVSFTQDMASELLYPLLPLFLTGVLAAPALLVGVVEGCAEAAAGLSKYLAGRMSDTSKHGRRPFIAVGYGMAAIGKVIVASAWVWPVVLLGRVVDRLGKGVRSAPRDALLADSVGPSELGRAFGFHRMGDSLGAVVGPILGLALLASLNGDVRAAMWFAAIPAALSVMLVFLSKDTRSVRKQAPKTDDPIHSPEPIELTDAKPEVPARAELPSQFKRVASALVLIALINFPDALLLLRLSDIGWTATEVVAAYVVFNLVYAASSYPGGVLADRLPPAQVYAVGLLAFAVGYGGLAVFDGANHAVGFALVAVYGLFPGLTDGVGKAWISRLVPAEQRGRAQGVFQSLQNGAVFVAGVWAGLFWTFGPGQGIVPLTASAVLAVCAALVLGASTRFRAPPEP